MPKAELKVDVKVVLEMSLAEAQALRYVLGELTGTPSRQTYDVFDVLADALDKLPTVAGGAE